MGRYYRRRRKSRVYLSKKEIKLLFLILFLPITLAAVIIKAICALSKNGKRKQVENVNANGATLASNDAAYVVRNSIMTECEKHFFLAIKEVVKDEYIVQPQINLASIIVKDSLSKYRNELFRNVDFGIFDHNYRPLVLIEINDSTHESGERKNRDKKVLQICNMANIPLVTFWTQYGVNRAYIEKKLSEHLTLKKENSTSSAWK